MINTAAKNAIEDAIREQEKLREEWARETLKAMKDISGDIAKQAAEEAVAYGAGPVFG